MCPALDVFETWEQRRLPRAPHDDPSPTVPFFPFERLDGDYAINRHQSREGGSAALAPEIGRLGAKGLRELLSDQLPRRVVEAVRPDGAHACEADDWPAGPLQHHEVVLPHFTEGGATSR